MCGMRGHCVVLRACMRWPRPEDLGAEALARGPSRRPRRGSAAATPREAARRSLRSLLVAHEDPGGVEAQAVQDLVERDLEDPARRRPRRGCGTRRRRGSPVPCRVSRWRPAALSRAPGRRSRAPSGRTRRDGNSKTFARPPARSCGAERGRILRVRSARRAPRRRAA